MTADHEVLLAPDDPGVFESLCLDLFGDIWGPSSGAQKNGRSGQPQAGVDVFGRSGDDWVGVQCKQKSGLLRSKVTVAELEREVAAARGFRPDLGRFILATTGPRDAKIQERARELTGNGFAVEVWSWQELWAELYGRRELFERLFPKYWPGQAGVRRRRVRPSKLRHSAQVLFGREEDLAELAAWWADPEIHIAILVAWGGVGKTSLVARWAAGLASREFDGADYFDVSFYSQGTRQKGAASADLFLDEALRFFGDEEMAESARSPWDKGARLAELVAERRTLLILDGLEPLQHPPGPLSGRFQDQGVAALLRGLANRNPGLCVVTTRVPVVDLAAFEGQTVREFRLEHLSREAGVALLEELGVQGARAELEALVEEVRGHALTLDLFGRYLKAAHGGDVRRRDLVKFEEADAEVQGGHAFRVMAAYERWLVPRVSSLRRLLDRLRGRQPAYSSEGHRQLAVLRLLGLFDRTADGRCLVALRRSPVIPGLTEPLVELAEADWNLAVSRLADHGLLREEVGGTLDAHPLVREHFGRRLRKERPSAWKAGHGRLFEFLKDTTEYQPDTVASLQPLYQAVYHGCLAERFHEACIDVYRHRILRGTEHYTWHKLGAFGDEVAAVACFFESPWSRVSSALLEPSQAWLLNEAGFILRALGRLTEAVEPFMKSLTINVRIREWRYAGVVAGNLSELELTLGDLAAAVRYAEQSVLLTNRGGTDFNRMDHLTLLGDALHQAGRSDEALARFREAEMVQAKREPQYQLLYLVEGYRYAELLLGGAERAAAGQQHSSTHVESCRAVEERALKTLGWRVPKDPVLGIALEHLTLGRARLYRGILDNSDLEDAQREIEQAVDGLRRASQVRYIPPGLLTRAWLCFALGDPTGARADLDEAQKIAERGPMPLHLADVHLYRAFLFLDRSALAEARRLVEKHRYGRRRDELDDLEAAAARWA